MHELSKIVYIGHQSFHFAPVKPLLSAAEQDSPAYAKPPPINNVNVNIVTLLMWVFHYDRNFREILCPFVMFHDSYTTQIRQSYECSADSAGFG